MSEQTRVIVLGDGLHAVPTLAVLSGNTLGALFAVAAMSSAGISSAVSIPFIVVTYLLAYPLLMLANRLYLREARRQALTLVQSALFAAMCVLTMWTIDVAVYKAFRGAAAAPQILSSTELPVALHGFSSSAMAEPHGPKVQGSTHYRKSLQDPRLARSSSSAARTAFSGK